MYRFPILLLFLSHIAFGQNDQVCKDLSRIIEMESKAFSSKFIMTVNEKTANYDLKYHRMEWDIDPAIKYISGNVTSYFVTTENDVDEINFDFSSDLTVNEVLYHGMNVPFIGTTDDNLQIDLPNTIQKGILDSLIIIYEGEPTSSGFGAFEVNSHNGTPVMWTLSEPYGAKEWWPCKQDLSDKIDSIDIFVKTPEAYKVASNGLLVNEISSDDFITYHWKHRYPIPAYLVAIAVTDYAIYSDYVPVGLNDSIEVLNYVYPEGLQTAINSTSNIVEIMTLFNELFELYPFADEKYGHAQFGWGGGMEHQTMSFMGDFSYDLQAHELAHQWFGDKITCGSWEDIWLNEGFATYLTGLSRQLDNGDEAFYNWRASRIGIVTSQPDGSVWVDDTTNVARIFDGRLTYNKGAMLLNMLRWKLGDEAFFGGIQNYLADPELAFAYATTEDLIEHLEIASGQVLQEFFDDWFYNQGFPSYQVSWLNTDKGISLTITQSTSHESVSFFEMPVPVQVLGQGLDTILRLEHTVNGQFFDIELPFVAEEVIFDPELMLISNGNRVDNLTVDINNLSTDNFTISPNPFYDRIHIEFNHSAQIPQKIILLDINGKVLHKSTNINHDFYLDTSSYLPGFYIINLEYIQEIRSKSMVKLR